MILRFIKGNPDFGLPYFFILIGKMKKISILLFLTLYALVQIAAQESTFKKQDKVLNFGLGFGSTLYTGPSYIVGIPPISACIEFEVKDGILDKGSIGIGGYLDYSSHKLDLTGWDLRYTNIVLGARGAFHYPIIDNLDIYTGIFLGYNFANKKEYGAVVPNIYYKSSGVVDAFFMGGRYYFSNKFAVMGELGYGITYLNLGVALKL
jgi:hypothetical protein